MLKVTEANLADTAAICRMLHRLCFPIHRLGYDHLVMAVARYARGDIQSLSKELYPYIAGCFGYLDWHPVEHSIRSAAADAWGNGDPQAWAYYFPGCRKAPSNKQLIATLAQFLQQNTPPDTGRG